MVEQDVVVAAEGLVEARVHQERREREPAAEEPRVEALQGQLGDRRLHPLRRDEVDVVRAEMPAQVADRDDLVRVEHGAGCGDDDGGRGCLRATRHRKGAAETVTSGPRR